MLPINAVFDTYKHHHEIDDIKKYAVAWMFREESLAEQLRIQALIQSQLPGLRQRLSWERQVLDAWKLRQLRIVVDWAFKTVPFYHEIYRTAGYECGGIRSFADFEALPVLTRNQIIENFPGNIVSSQYDKANCRWLSSSGSSGYPVQLIMQQDRTELDTLHRLRMFEQMHGQLLSKDDWIYNVNHAVWWHTSFNGEYPVFSVNQKCPLDSVLAHLKKLRPSFMSAITSYVELMASAGVNLAEFGIKTVATNSETSSVKQRRMWEQQLGVVVCDEYSSEEAGLLAHECRHGYYHLIEDDTYLEINNPDKNGYGSVLATDLWNFAMPIIRYNQGDFASHKDGDEKCGCGNNFRRIKEVAGRIDEAFESRNGKVLPGILLEATENFLSHDDSGMAEYRVIQIAIDTIEIIYVKHPEHPTFSRSLIEGFRSILSDLFGHYVQLELKQVLYIDDVERNKRKVLINNLGKDLR